MPHFFISTSDVNKDKIVISDKENYHHIIKVLRAKVGEKLSLIDENQTQYEAVIESFSNKSITTKILNKQKSNHFLSLNLCLAQSVLKTDAQNLVIQKATELGVKEIIPFVSDNSVIKEQVVDSKISKWQKIANEAVKQCERVDLPVVNDRTTLEQLLDDNSYDIKIACVERSQTCYIKEYLRSIEFSMDKKILVIIGPEGGFSSREIKLFESRDIQGVSLGKLILRAETAAINALSSVIYELEE